MRDAVIESLPEQISIGAKNTGKKTASDKESVGLDSLESVLARLESESGPEAENIADRVVEVLNNINKDKKLNDFREYLQGIGKKARS